MLKQIRLIPIMIALIFCVITVPAGAAPISPVHYDFAPCNDFLGFLADPNVAYLLLAIAVLGLSVEILTPGIIIPGTIGVVTSILAFMALSGLPVRAAGIALFILALPIFVLGAFVPSAFILFSVMGVAALISGSLLLFHDGIILHPALIAIVVSFLSASIIFVANRTVNAQPGGHSDGGG
jgi:membrane-bound ClpP family serine protease